MYMYIHKLFDESRNNLDIINLEMYIGLQLSYFRTCKHSPYFFHYLEVTRTQKSLGCNV